jgi:catechol 2,3-dioxygenase-like lactoylglutathione lyase family enzyme
MAKLDQINIVVGDMEAMADFYHRLGVELPAGPPEWAPHHRNGGAGDGVDLDLDSQQFAAVWNRGWPGGPGIVLEFRVPDRQSVDQLHEELTSAGYASQQEPYDAFWGSRFAVVADPDGNAVGLMSPRDDAFRTPGPPPPPG